jgi:hypothetical protein
MFASPRNAARRTLERNLQAFARAGCRRVARVGPLEARLERDGRRAIRIRLAREGRVFGGSYALEATTADAVFPATRGVSGRGRGLVRLGGVSFRARRGDEEGRRLAERLEQDDRLAETLAKVDFDRIRIQPDGRPVIRHMGGSVVWMLFPPLVRPVPLVDEQARAIVDALDAFAQAGGR